MRRLSSKHIALLAAAGVLVAAILPLSLDGKDDAPTAGASKGAAAITPSRGPNVIFIYSDDQTEQTFTRRNMPRTFRLIVDKGTRFTGAITATPICCPSRVSYLTGQYPHNNGVFSNGQGYSSLTAPGNTLPSWMQLGGYRTSWVGKFLQGYTETRDLNVPAPGFDDWAVTSEAAYFGYQLFEENRTREFGYRDRDYHTDVLTRKATEIVRREIQPRSPFFMTLNYLAPHKGKTPKRSRCDRSAQPAPRDVGSERGLSLPMPPSFDEEDVSDKRAFVETRRVEGSRVDALRVQNRCRVESLRAVDRGIAKVLAEVRKARELDNTIFVFTSDNGILLGEHRLEGKGKPYEEALQVPLAIRAPSRVLGSKPVGTSDALVANIDLAPTLLDLTGNKPCVGADECRRLDGRSLVPLLEGRGSDPFDQRSILIEGWFEGDTPCDFRGVRSTDAVLIQRARGNPSRGGCTPASEPELYDLARDEFQLDNLAVTDPAGSEELLDEMLRRLEKLENCSGVRGRDASGPSPFCS